MTQEKLRKVITASVVAATLLLVFLLSYLTYQWIALAVQKKRIKEYEQNIARLEEVIEKGEQSAEYYESVFYRDLAAWLAGYTRPQENK